MDQLTLNQLQSNAAVEQEANKKIISNYLHKLIGQEVPVKLYINTYSKHRVSIGIEFLKEADNPSSSYFGAGIDIDYSSTYNFDKEVYEAPKLKLNTSSCGGKSRQDNPGLYLRAKTQISIWDHEEEFKELLENLKYDETEVFKSASSEFSKECAAKEAENTAKRIEALNSSLLQGKTFKSTIYDKEYFASITSITPKRLYFSFGVLNQNCYKTGYVDKEKMVYRATWCKEVANKFDIVDDVLTYAQGIKIIYR